MIALTGVYLLHRDIAAQYNFYQQNETYVRTLHKDYESLQQEERRLQAHVDGLKSDPVEVEADIRRQKSLVRPGERVYRVELGSPQSTN